MAARLPAPGKDQGKWGEILNEYLTQSLSPNGLLKHGVVNSSNLADGAVTTAKIADAAVTSAKIDPALFSQITTGVGAQGPTGPQGPAGATGAQGPAGPAGTQGPKGDRGDAGAQGVAGTPGVQGLQGPKGDKGDTGNTGAQGTAGPAGVGVPTGGSTGQVLAKASNSNHDTAWINVSGGGGGPVAWGDIQNIPSTFAPSTHSHPISDITNLQTTLAGKANASSLSAVATSGSASDIASGTLAVARLAPYSMMAVHYSGSSWPARPTSRTDITVHWIGATESTPPPNALTGVDIWDREN